MGCDIHACVEIRGVRRWRWRHAGEADIGRNYELFAVLANVRNYDGVPVISDPRGLPEDVNSQFRGYSDDYGRDGHSHSWVTLAEMKAYDLDQEYDDERLVLSRDDDGRVRATARWSSIPTLGPVGRTQVFGVFGPAVWLALVARLEAAKGEGMSDDDVRLVFFFDN